MGKKELRTKINEFLHVFIKTFQQADVTIYAIVVTYYMLLSFFPLLIAVGNILPYLHINEQTVLPYIQDFFPPDIYAVLNDTIQDLLTSSSSSLLSISAIGTIWAISKGINGIQISLNKAYGLEHQKKQIFKRVGSFFMVFLLLIAIVVLLFAMAFGQTILENILPALGLPQSILHTFKTLRWPVTLTILFVVLLWVYYFVHSAKVHFKTIVPGAIFTTVSWMVITQFFSLYVTYFSKRITSYGIIGGFLLFMLWLDVAATLIIVGGVINVTVEKVYYGHIEVKQNKISTYVDKKMKNVETKFKEKRLKKNKN